MIPSRVTLSVDVRAPDDERLEQVAAVVLAGFHAAGRWRCRPNRALRCWSNSPALGEPGVELPSGAGHDAGVLAAAGVPAAMLFVRSLNGGISHSPDELSADEDVELAVDVLTGALDRLASAVDD